jgi:hypothetical protein
LGDGKTVGLLCVGGLAQQGGAQVNAFIFSVLRELLVHHQWSYLECRRVDGVLAVSIRLRRPLLYFVCSLFVPSEIGYEWTPTQKGNPYDDANHRSVYRSVCCPVDREGISGFTPQRSKGPRKASRCVRISGRGNQRGSQGCRPRLGAFAYKHQKFIPAKSNRLVRQVRSYDEVETGLSHRASKSILPRYCISITRSSGSLDHSIARNAAPKSRRPYR